MRAAVLPTISLIVVALLAAAISAASGLKFWWAFLIVAGAVLINGLVATLEDDLPGGFNNPDGSDTPTYAVVASRVFRVLGVVLVLLCLAALALHFCL